MGGSRVASGRHGRLGKATNYEIATRVPLIAWTPDLPKSSRGSRSSALVELIDMYPTLCDLAGVGIPNHLEGTSFAPLLENPNRKWKTAAFSQYPNPALREWAANPLSQGVRETFFGPLIEKVEDRIIKQQGEKWDRDLFENDLMGYAMRTDRYRLVVWKDYTSRRWNRFSSNYTTTRRILRNRRTLRPNVRNWLSDC